MDFKHEIIGFKVRGDENYVDENLSEYGTHFNYKFSFCEANSRVIILQNQGLILVTNRMKCKSCEASEVFMKVANSRLYFEMWKKAIHYLCQLATEAGVYYGRS